MRLPLLLSPLKWIVVLGLLGGLLFGLFLARERMQSERDGKERSEQEGTQPRSKVGFVNLEDDEAERYGLREEPARLAQWYEPVSIYGRVVPNPRATVEVRSPFAGDLRAAADASWPRLGKRVKEGQTLGWVDVRVGPEVRLDFQNKWTEARIRQRGAEEEVQLQQSRVDSLKDVTSQQIISRVELDNALVQLTQAKSQLAMARAAVDLWQKALEEPARHKGVNPSAWSRPLTAPADGEVTNLMGRPGTSVEAGAVVLDVVDFRRLLVRLDFPPEVLERGELPRRVEVQTPLAAPSALSGTLNPPPSRTPSRPVEACLVGPSPRVHAALQFLSYWYEVRLPASAAATAGVEAKDDRASRIIWRPGMQVVAIVRRAAALPAVAVPAGAVLYHEGRPLVYVRVAPETYQRREVRLLGREGDRWLLAARQGDLPVGVAPEEIVVSHQAQVMLSKEFLAGGANED